MFLSRKIISQRMLLILSLPFWMFCSLLQADVYRWVDSNGEVRYTDRPSPESLKVKKEDRPKRVEVKESVPLSAARAGVSDHMNAARYYRTPGSHATPIQQDRRSRSVEFSKGQKEAQKQQQTANEWFREHCAYYAKSTQVHYTPYDIGAQAFRQKQGVKPSKAEMERDKRLDNMVENRAKQQEHFRKYAAAKGLAAKSSLNEKQLKNAYKLKMQQRSRVKSFDYACEDDNGEVYPEFSQYEPYLVYPKTIDPEAMDQFIADNPDIRVE